MDEEVFHYVIVNQIKMNIAKLVGEALGQNTAKNAVGIVGAGRQINKTFDVTCQVEAQEGKGKWNKGVLFRIQIKLTKLPPRNSYATVNEIINCLETFLSADSDQANWQASYSWTNSFNELGWKSETDSFIGIRTLNIA
jgi:hypothetical protein